MADLSNFKIDPNIDADAVLSGDNFKSKYGFNINPNILDEQPSRSVYDDNSGNVIQVPADTSLDQGFYFDDVNRQGGRKDGFFGYVNGAAKIAAGAKTGAAAMAITSGQNLLNATSLRENDIRADLYSRDMNISDVANILNPLDPTASKTTLGVLLAKSFLNKDQEFARSANAKANQAAIFNLMKRQREDLATAGYNRPDGAAGVAYDIGGGATSIVTSLGLFALTRSPALVAASMGSMQKNSVYIEARDKGKGQFSAGAISSVAGAFEGALEMVGVKTFFGLGVVDNILGRVALRSAEEAVQEGSQQTAEEILTQTTGLRKVDIKGGFGRVVYSMMLGGVIGAPVATMVEIGNNVDVDNNIEPQAMEILAKALGRDRSEYVDRVTQIIEDEMSKPTDAKAYKKVSEILNKFDSGEDIDIKQEIGAIQEFSDTEKQALFEDIDNSIIGAKIRTDNKVAQFRIDAIDAQTQNVNREIKALSSDLENREILKKPTKAVQNRIDKLTKVKEELDLRKEDLVKYFDGKKVGPLTEEEMITRKEVLGVTKNEKVSLKARVLSQINSRNSSELESKTKKVFNKAQKIARDDVELSQRLVHEFIKETGLDKYKEGNRLITQLRSVKSSKNIDEKLSKIQSHAEKLIAKIQKKEIADAIKAKIKQTKLNKGGRLPVGKFTATAQKVFDSWRDISVLNKEQASERLSNNIENESGDIIENTLLLNKVNPDAVSPETLAELYTAMSGTVKNIRGGVLAVYEAQEAAANDLKLMVIDGATAGDGLAAKDTTALKNKLAANLNNVRSYISFGINAWYDTMDLVLGKTKEGRVAREALSKMVAESILNEKIMTHHFHQKFHDAYKDSSGFTKEGHVNKKLRSDEKEENQGDFIREGESRATPWVISRSQMRYIYSALKNDKLRKKLTSPNGNKISKDMEEHIERTLEREDFDIIDMELDMYKDLYDAINPVYEKKYGVSLNKEDFYVMSRAEHGNLLNDKDEFLEDLHHYSTATSSIHQKRTTAENPIKIGSDVRFMLNYISQASNFINKAEMSRVLHQVFGDSDVNIAIQRNWGDVMNNTIRNMVDDFITGHNQREELGYKLVDKVYQNFVVSKLGNKLNMIPKQTSSLFGYAAVMPADQWAVGFADFVSDPMKAIKILSEIDYMKIRGSDQDYNTMRQYADNYQTVFKSGWVRAGEKSMLPVKLGDRFAIYAGGWAVYKYNIDVLGKTHEEAVRAFVETTELTQQSSMQDKLSRLQASSNPFVRTITMFTSSPIGYLRAEMRAVRRAVRGEIPIKTAAKQVAIYHFVLPALFQFIADGFSYDEESQKRAALLGPANVVPIVGGIVYRAVAFTQGEHYKSKGFSIFDSIEAISMEVAHLIMNEEIDMVEVASAIGDLFGQPIGTDINITEGLIDISEGDIHKGLLRASGYTEKTAEKRVSGDSGGGYF